MQFVFNEKEKDFLKEVQTFLFYDKALCSLNLTIDEDFKSYEIFLRNKKEIKQRIVEYKKDIREKSLNCLNELYNIIVNKKPHERIPDHVHLFFTFFEGSF